jgi:hypothetical protein
MDDGEGLGSLADELGGWSGDEEGEEFVEEEEEEEGDLEDSREQERDSGIDVTSSPPHLDQQQSPSATSANGKLLSPTQTASEKGRRKKGLTSTSYDGSEYGSESDLEQTELVSATLEARLSVVEALARRGMEENGSEGDRVISRVTESLKDLGGQSGIESGATRYASSFSLSCSESHADTFLAD